MKWLLKLLRLDQDSLRESRIDQYRQKLVLSDSVEERLLYWRLMKAEIQARSPEQVERMEREIMK